jgi:4-cresol dehydrogenase (hydroxylating)
MPLPPTPLQQAVAAWTQLLGPDCCVAGADARAQGYEYDVGEYDKRVIPAILYPTSPVDVQAIVRVANTYKIPLYSLSLGKNWGLGSRQPVQHHGVAVDLSHMQQIRTLNLDEGHVIIEPGVTQQALSDALASTAYIANLTASTPETSVVGNVLDKGIGFYRHRVEDLLGIEVVLGDGNLVHIGGYWPMGQARFYFPSGLGPTLTPLFLQSNFGIVTACALKLIPRPETLHILYATLASDRLEQGLAVVKQLRADQTLNSVIKLYNAHAFHAYSGQQASAEDQTYHVMAALHGSTAWVRHVGPFVANTLQQSHYFDTVTILDQDGLTRAPQLIQVLARVFAGQPTRFAVQQALALRHAGECGDVDRVSRQGLLFIIPVVPLTGAAILQTLAILDKCSLRYQIPINTTINVLSESAVEMVSSIIFRRAPESIRQAHLLKKRLVEAFYHHDIPLMRLDIDAQNDTQVFLQANYKDVLVQLKHLFDPNLIIAPGRYIPQA